MEMARKLLEGTFHEEEEEDDEEEEIYKPIEFTSYHEEDHKIRIDRFETQLK